MTVLQVFGFLWVFFTTTFFFKGTTLGIVGLNGAFFLKAWQTRTFPKGFPQPLFIWGGFSLYLFAHTFFRATDLELSLSPCFRLVSFLLQVAFLQVWTSSPQLLLQTLRFSPSKPPLFPLMTLFLICFVGLQVQFFQEGLLTALLNQIFSTSLTMPRSFKPYLALLIPPFFLVMGMTFRQFSGSLKALPACLLGLSLFVLGFSMHAYTDCLVLLFGMITFFAYLAFPRTTLIVTASGIFAMLFLFPFYAHHLWHSQFFSPLSTSVFTFGQRVLHWSELLPFITEKFWLGWGLKHSYALSESNAVIYPLMYPHNIIFELWIDLGFVGILWAAGFISILLRCISRSPNRIASASGITLLVGAFTMGQSGYSNVHTWWAASLSLCAFFIQAWIALPESLQRLQQTTSPPFPNPRNDPTNARYSRKSA